MDRCWLGGSSGNALHAVLCAAGFNIRWLLLAIAAKGLAALLFVYSRLALYAARMGKVLRTPTLPNGQTERRLQCPRWPATSSPASG